jgi:hypothetical protein
MENTHAHIDTDIDVDDDIASLRANIAKYRALAEARRAHGHVSIASQLTEFIADLEARMAVLEARAKSNGSVTAHRRHNGYE